MLEVQADLMESPRIRMALDQAKTTGLITRNGKRELSTCQGSEGGTGFFRRRVVTGRQRLFNDAFIIHPASDDS
tara:strand:+ start:674 stop:895 length:222 start_codon:yes stop_codon:yes gene_type:complete